MAEQQRMAELDIIQQAQSGNPAAYGELYAQHMDAIYRYIHKRVNENGEAEDLTQTVFIKAWQALRDYKPTGAPFRAWLYRIAHNAVVDYYRTQRDPLLWDDLAWMTDPHSTPENRLLDTERQETVRNAIAKLRPTYQAVIVRRFLHNMDYAETAAALDSQVNHVRVLQHRALEALRQVLTQESALWLAILVTMITLLLGGNIVVAAERALPGDNLYPMRTIAEEMHLWLADDSTDIQLHASFATQRVNELQALYQKGRIDDMVATVAQLSLHVRTAAAKVTIVTQADSIAQPTLTAKFAQTLDQQSAALNALTVTAPAPLQAILQPAIDAVVNAQTSLPDPASEPPVIMPTATALATATAPVQATPDRQQAPTPHPPTPIATQAAAPVQSSTFISDPVATQRDNDGTASDSQATNMPGASPTRTPIEKEGNRSPAQADSVSVEQQHPARPPAETAEDPGAPVFTNPPNAETQPAPTAHLDANLAQPDGEQVRSESANEGPSDLEQTDSPADRHNHEPDASPEDRERQAQSAQPAEQPAQAAQAAEPRPQPNASEAEPPGHENKRKR